VVLAAHPGASCARTKGPCCGVWVFARAAAGGAVQVVRTTGMSMRRALYSRPLSSSRASSCCDVTTHATLASTVVPTCGGRRGRYWFIYEPRGRPNEPRAPAN
jgi:hypothetical protein